MARFWISWWMMSAPLGTEHGGFELRAPWWVSGEREPDGARSICAALIAKDGRSAKEFIAASHDGKPDVESIEWRFCTPKPADWSPFSERFPRADWMEWPAWNVGDVAVLVDGAGEDPPVRVRILGLLPSGEYDVEALPGQPINWGRAQCDASELRGSEEPS